MPESRSFVTTGPFSAELFLEVPVSSKSFVVPVEFVTGCFDVMTSNGCPTREIVFPWAARAEVPGTGVDAWMPRTGADLRSPRVPVYGGLTRRGKDDLLVRVAAQGSYRF